MSPRVAPLSKAAVAHGLPLPSGGLLSPLDQAILERLEAGVLVFDVDGRLLYATEVARRVVGIDHDPQLAPSLDILRPRLAGLGGVVTPLHLGSAALGELVLLPRLAEAPTLAEQERVAILEALRRTGGRRVETAQRLGVSRTTLWRRLKAYGIDERTNGDKRDASIR